MQRNFGHPRRADTPAVSAELFGALVLMGIGVLIGLFWHFVWTLL